MSEERYVLSMDGFDRRLLIAGMNEFRNTLLQTNKPVEDVNALLMRVIDAPRSGRRRCREER